MYKKIIKIIFLISALVLFSCNNNTSAPIRSRKIAPKISTVYKSPAYNLRIRYIILHYTALDDDLSLKVLTDPGVSAHYLVTTREDDPIYKLVDDSNRAWHAGITMYNNRELLVIYTERGKCQLMEDKRIILPAYAGDIAEGP